MAVVHEENLKFSEVREHLDSLADEVASIASDLWSLVELERQLARAEIAWQLGKRFNQDEALDWGCAVDRAEEDLAAWCAPGATMKK